MPKFRVIPPALLAALALVACGDEPDKNIGPKDPVLTVEEAAAYFGVEPCKCYEYKSTDPGEPRLLGVAVERVDDHYTEAGDRNDKHVLVYRLGSSLQKRYVLEPTTDELLLSRVYEGDGISDPEWRLSPHATWLRYPMKTGAEIARSTEMSKYENGLPVEGESHDEDFRVITASSLESINASLDGGEREPFEAIRVETIGAKWREGNRWFVPEIGNVRLDVWLPSMDKRTSWVLHNVRMLDESCPGTELRDFCGSSTRP